jgi:cathepsin L
MSKTLLALGTIALLGSLMMINQQNSLDFPQKFESFK